MIDLSLIAPAVVAIDKLVQLSRQRTAGTGAGHEVAAAHVSGGPPH